MDQHARGAFLIAQAACMQAELMSMQERNRLCTIARQPAMHLPQEFMDLPIKYGLDHNAAITYLMGN